PPAPGAAPPTRPGGARARRRPCPASRHPHRREPCPPPPPPPPPHPPPPPPPPPPAGRPPPPPRPAPRPPPPPPRRPAGPPRPPPPPRRLPPGPTVAVIVLVSAHFAPARRFGDAAAEEAVRSWCAAYEALAGHYTDAGGRPFQHTWFYRCDYPNPGCL